MYPVNLQMKGISCLVIGGGHIAFRKVKKLVQEEARVTVLAPEISEELKQLCDEKKIRWKAEPFTAGDTRGYTFVVTACGVQSVAEEVHKESLASFFLYNAADFPSLGNCFLPASFELDHIQFAISTNGRSPAMARYVKNWLQTKIPSSFGEWLERVGDIRQNLKRELETSEMRENFWHTVFNDQIMDLVVEGKLDEAEECVRHAVGCFRS